MTAPSRPDVDSATEVFSGDTLDEALASARAAHGPQVRVVRAQRARQGFRGLLGRERYDVVVRLPETTVTVLSPEPAPRPEPVRRPRVRRREDDGDPVHSAFADLLAAADESERAAPEEPSWAWNGEEDVSALLHDLTAWSKKQLALEAGPHPAPELVASEGNTDRADRAHRADRSGAPRREPARAPARPRPPRRSGEWDRAHLRSLGVPHEILGRLPIEDPETDEEWRTALREAIAAAVPAPSSPDADHPFVVSGHGVPGAVAILRTAVRDGATPGMLTFEGRRRAAGPKVLVEVLASCVHS